MNRLEACVAIHNETLQSFYSTPQQQQKVRQLKTILFASLIQFQTASLMDFFRFGENLLLIDLSKNSSQVTDEVIEVIGQSCRKLRNLDIQQCCLVTDRGMESIGQHLQQLVELTVRYNMLITKEGVRQVLQYCVNIQKVDATLCKIDQNGIDWLKERVKIIWTEDFVFYRRMKPAS